MFIFWIPEKLSKDEMREKFDYMFNRIGSQKAKVLAKSLYLEALKKLEAFSD